MSLSIKEELAIAQARELLSASGVWAVEDDLQSLVDRFIRRHDPEQAIREFMLAVQERCSRVPLGHILGSAPFDGLPLAVGTGVFVPRTHSQIFHRWLDGRGLVPRGGTVLDLCAGTGAIGLGIARRRPDLRVICVEADEVAYQYLERNIHRLADLGARAEAWRADVRDSKRFDGLRGRVGLIVANPPYVPEHQPLLPEWQAHHPQASVYAGADGLALIRSIVQQAVDLLGPEGWLLIEHAQDQAERVRHLFQRSGFSEVETLFESDISDASGLALMTAGSRPLQAAAKEVRHESR